jgi:DNA repair exonuclease SbcCD nuclease subunit
MRIACVGDQHITSKKPKNRTDNYFETILGKLRQEFEIAREFECPVLIMPGDVFDKYNENHYVVQQVIHLIREFHPIQVLAVAGQHDQQFHNPDISGTALGTLLAAGVITILSQDPTPITYGVSVYGASWKDEVPVIITPNYCNILVLHKMIVDEKLWAEQEGHTWCNQFLQKNKFDLIVSGDNHKRFFAKSGKKTLVNMGAMMRSSIAQVDHKPMVAIYDTDSKETTFVDLKIEPMENVMCLEKAKVEKEKNEQLEAFVKSLKDAEFGEHGEVAVKLDFLEILKEYMEEAGTDPAISKIIYEATAE